MQQGRSQIEDGGTADFSATTDVRTRSEKDAMPFMVEMSSTGVDGFSAFDSPFIGFETVVRNHENSGGIISAWVVALVTTWFFCVVIISGTNLWLWFTKLSSNTIIWPDLVAELRYLFAGTGFQGLEVLLLCFAVPLLAVVPLILSYSRETRGNFWQIGVVSIVCTVTCAVFIAATIFFLRPVTQGCNPLTQANCL